MKAIILSLTLLTACSAPEMSIPSLLCNQRYGYDLFTCSRIGGMDLKAFNDERQMQAEIDSLRKELADALHSQFVCEGKLGKGGRP